MNKFFKRSVIGSAVAAAVLASSAASAYVIAQTDENSVEMYGVVSISAVDYGTTDSTFVLENESRIGFRASQVMTDSVEAFVQMESGWMLDDGAKVGNRDTFVGMRGDDWGQVRFGRMLTPMYELVDWPYSASNMGTTFDRGWRAGERFHFDRKSQQIRFDSAKIGDMAKFSASVGNGSQNTDDSKFFGASFSINPVEMLTLHLAMENTTDTDFDANTVGDTNNLFAGFEIRPIDNVMLAGAYKTGEFDKDAASAGNGYNTRDIDAFSLQANYYMGATNFRLGYASQDGETNGTKDEFLKRETITGEVGHSFNSVYTFLRVAQQSDAEGSYKGDDTMVRIGTEWYF
ncbi:porin [Enterovibrio norvegicus FF-33]|uniref:Porin n=1 Tax=Enterovibrio norvegicus FF-454 TaxID=1185651 RepID=A0A1E5C636_9GAMM|nr:porin [Enterovibrio norvegicus]OEE60991.1 porin [Enterovibrio norvegicus FF-454]OEE68211.1 porin [Enterovibrio norvegicus FF-33]OEE74969.1 porin [Enterovibrio norvegicus FF-162]